MRKFSIFLACILTPVALNADFLNYTFTGVIPVGASGHSQVSDGESFVASFIVDTTVPDTEPGDPTLGEYLVVVQSGSLEFSGGFNSSLDFSGLNVFVGDDFADTFDAVLVGNDDFTFLVQANQFEDLSVLNSDALPGAGDAFAPDGGGAGVSNNQLSYTDDFGSIFYDTGDANNISFSATAVPEPSAVSLFAFLAITATTRRAKRS